MAYQNVGTPVFYVDYLLWRKSLGLQDGITLENVEFDLSTIQKTLNLNPTNPVTLYNYDFSSANASYIELLAPPPIPSSTSDSTRYFAVLGHNLKSAGIELLNSAVVDHGLVSDGGVNVVNGSADYDGFSIVKDLGGLIYETSENDGVYRIFLGVTTESDLKVGCYSVGNYYQMPHSPDLSLTMTREYGGIKTIETKGGASLSNAFYTKPPKWGSFLSAWELSDSNEADPAVFSDLSRSGRRIWDLSFSYLQDSDVFGSNQSIGNWHSSWEPFVESPEYEDGDVYNTNIGFNYNILTDYNFYSQVIHKTNGGQLPFIFQPDKNNSNPDQFAICKLDMKSFKFDQVANGVYNVKLKIREVW